MKDSDDFVEMVLRKPCYVAFQGQEVYFSVTAQKRDPAKPLEQRLGTVSDLTVWDICPEEDISGWWKNKMLLPVRLLTDEEKALYLRTVQKNDLTVKIHSIEDTGVANIHLWKNSHLSIDFDNGKVAWRNGDEVFSFFISTIMMWYNPDPVHVGNGHQKETLLKFALTLLHSSQEKRQRIIQELVSFELAGLQMPPVRIFCDAKTEDIEDSLVCSNTIKFNV